MRRSAWLLVALAFGGVALGVVAEVRAGYAAGPAAADLAVGWLLLACGLWGLAERPAQRRWPLVLGSCAAWFAADLAPGAHLVYLHRGPLVHAAVGATRDRSPLAAAAIALGYADAIVVGDANGWLSLATIVTLVLLAARRIVAEGLERSAAIGSIAALAIALGLAASTVLPDRVSAAYTDKALYAYEAALCACAVLLVAAATREARVGGTVADLVVELGPAHRSPGVRESLARVLGDPTLAIGYWIDDGHRYVDVDGNPFTLPDPGGGRATTIVERDGQRIAALVHDPSLLDDAQLVGAVREAAGLMLAHHRLQAEAEARLSALRASRERLIAARDEQRRRLARRLQDGADRRLAQVADTVAQARAGATAEQLELLDLFEGELDGARAELRALAHGIHPRVLTERGLASALAALGAQAPLPVALTVPDGRLPPRVEAAAYFICSEALANVAKHAQATGVRCDVTRDGDMLHVTVADDGIGGADLQGGSGLRGLADRVEAVGGRLCVTSPPGTGTTVAAALPLQRELV